MGHRFIGPWDLGNNIGHPVLGDFDPELSQAITRIREAAKSAGKWSGIYCPNGDVARKYADEGFQMVRPATENQSSTRTANHHLDLGHQRHDRHSHVHGPISFDS